MNLKNKKVLVTGADGFIGSHLVEALLNAKCDVRALVYYNAFNSWGWLDTFEPSKKAKLDVVLGDVRDPNGMQKALKDVDVVFHLAALIGIPFSYHSPDTYVDTNIKGTLNILQAARTQGASKVLITSTSEVYGTARYVPINEDHPRQAQSPYAATKIAADALAFSFYRSFDLPVSIVRPFNTYGPRQSARAVIPTIISQLLSGKKQLKLGNLAPTRDMVYVQDVVQAFLAVAQSDKTVGEEINIATGEEISIADLAIRLKHLTNTKAAVLEDKVRTRPQASEVDRLLGDNRKITALTGWTPGVDLEAGLRKTVAWFKDAKNLRAYKPDDYNI
jgi:NAD dependent epimerase/dehydratase